MAQVHYWELSHYNNAINIGKWFNLDNVTEAEHLAEVSAWLAELTEETGELCEEVIIGDTEGVPDQFVSEWSIDGDYFEMVEILAASHMDAAAFLAGVELGIPAGSIEDAYYGEYSSEAELAEEYAESTGMLDALPENLHFYFNFEAFGRDLAMDFSEHDGHYFLANW